MSISKVTLPQRHWPVAIPAATATLAMVAPDRHCACDNTRSSFRGATKSRARNPSGGRPRREMDSGLDASRRPGMTERDLRRRQLVINRIVRIPLLLAAIERRAVVRRDRIVVLKPPRQVRVGDEDTAEGDD